MPYEEVGAFIAKLRARDATSALALELCILTAARSGEILGMRWSEIDLDKKVWTVPANRMKAGREHRMQVEDVTVHGFRSSFRDWAGNVSNFTREIVETALAHVIGDKAEQAYRRSDALEKRRKLMNAWATYCEPKRGGNVVQIGARKAI